MHNGTDSNLDTHFDRTSKLFNAVSLSVLCVLLISLILYKLIGFDGIVTTMYEGKASLSILNTLIKYQETKSLTHYIDLASTLFERGIFIAFIFLGYINLIFRSLFSKKTPSIIWVFLWGTFVILGVNFLNPNNRIYSSHGLMHIGIVYEILQGFIPPSNPLLSGQTLYWPWGHHFLAAAFVKIFGISPPWAFCVINILSLYGTVIVISRICRMFTSQTGTWVLPSLISIFAVSFIHERGVPIFERFLNISGMPIGIFFFLLFVYSILKLFKQDKHRIGFSALLMVSVLGTGFFYFQLLPGLVGSYCVFFCYRLIRMIHFRKYNDLSKILLSSASVCIGLVFLFPYISLVSTNSGDKIHLFIPEYMLQNILIFLTASAPMLIVLALSLKYIKKCFDIPVVLNYAILTLGVLAVNIFVHIPEGNEYKYMSQAVIHLGILGGVILSLHTKANSKVLILIFITLLGYQFFKGVDWRLNVNYKALRLYESGTKIITKTEEDQIYEWIYQNTSFHTPVIDLEMQAPYMAQRPLYTVRDKFVDGNLDIYPGYGMSVVEILTSIGSYDINVINSRDNIVDWIYGHKALVDGKELDLFFSENPDIIVIETDTHQISQDAARHFTLKFESSDKRYRVYTSRQLF